MSDLISRQAVMKEFSDFVRRANNSDFAKTPTWNDAVSLVGSLPSEEVTLCHLDSPCEYQNADIAMPSAERVGKWIETSNGDHWKCSRCNCRAGFWFNEENSCGWSMDMSEWLSDFCPNCGARMRGDGDDIC